MECRNRMEDPHLLEDTVQRGLAIIEDTCQISVETSEPRNRNPRLVKVISHNITSDVHGLLVPSLLCAKYAPNTHNLRCSPPNASSL